MPKFTVLLSCTVQYWKRVTITAGDAITAARDAIDATSDEDSLDAWHIVGESYPEHVKEVETDPLPDAPCPDCGGELHQCATGDAGCMHCGTCQGSPDDLDEAIDKETTDARD